MRLAFVDILACPHCAGHLLLEQPVIDADGDVIAGVLRCVGCRDSFAIEAGIPRFVQTHAADASFGFQWNRFRREQLDSADGAGISAQRLWSETQWAPAELSGRRVLDVGCGAGRFLEVVSQSDGHIVGVDVSRAIDAAAVTVRGRTNVDLVQADVYRLPFRPGVFDDCYCIGVAQHTPDPVGALKQLPRLLRPGGRLAVTVYERRKFTRLNGKYLLRPLTRRMNKRVLMAAIQLMMPVLFPVTELLFSLPKIGRLAAFVLPVANYVELKQLSYGQRYRLALLDTFDRLAPAFDLPLTEPEVVETLRAAGMANVRRLPGSGVNVIGERASRSLESSMARQALTGTDA